MRRAFGEGSHLEPRFIGGTLAEIEQLFGGSIPDLPEGPLGPAMGETFLVDLFPPIRKSLRDLVEYIYRGLSGDGGGDQANFATGKDAAPFDHFEQVLERVLATIVDQERRLGLLNLFWLAHSKAVAEVLQEFFSQPGIKVSISTQMHPFLKGVHRNPLERVWARFKHRNGNSLRQNLGAGFNTALIDCIIDDQLPFTEVSAARLNFQQILVDNNKRFRLSFAEFREMNGAFRDRLRDVLHRKDPQLLDMIRRWAPGVRPETYEEERATSRLLFNTHLVTYLLAEFTGEAAAGFRSPVSRLERVTGRHWRDLVLDYLDIIEAMNGPRRSTSRARWWMSWAILRPRSSCGSGTMRGLFFASTQRARSSNWPGRSRSCSRICADSRRPRRVVFRNGSSPTICTRSSIRLRASWNAITGGSTNSPVMAR